MFRWAGWCDETRADVLRARCRELLEESGFDIRHEQWEMFEPQGFTDIFVLAESHFAIHTFPERGCSYLELTSCVSEPYWRFVEHAEGMASGVETSTSIPLNVAPCPPV